MCSFPFTDFSEADALESHLEWVDGNYILAGYVPGDVAEESEGEEDEPFWEDLDDFGDEYDDDDGFGSDGEDGF